MSVIDFTSVATSLGRPISDPAEIDQVTQWIADAEMLIRIRLGALAALDQEALRFVVREAVVARVQNPDGLESRTHAIDDYSTTERYATGTRRVHITDDWWALLNPTIDQTSSSIRPYFEPDFARHAVSTPPFADREWWPGA